MGATITAPAFTMQQIPDYGIPTYKLNNALIHQMLDMEIGIMIATTAGQFSPDLVIPDVFSQAQGKESSIDTTAFADRLTFSTDQYQFDPGNVSEFSIATGSTDTQSDKQGFSYTPTANMSLVAVQKNTACTTTTAYLQNAAGGAIAQATFAGNTATFATPVSLTASTKYRIVSDSGGSNYTRNQQQAHTIPWTGTYGVMNSTWQGATEYSSGSPSVTNVSALVFANPYTTGKLVTAALSGLDGAVIQVGVYLYNLTLSAGATATMDVDIGGDGTYEYTGLPVNALNSVPETLAGAKVRVNLNKGTSSGISSYKGQCIMVVE